MLESAIARATFTLHPLPITSTLWQVLNYPNAQTMDDWLYLPQAIATAKHDLAVSVYQQYTHWMLVHPLHMALQRDTFNLRAINIPNIDEAKQLIDYLNQHFIAQGVQFYLGQSGAWYAGFAQALDIQVLPVACIENQLLQHVLPKGPHAGRWRNLSNEIQMLLFEHAVNQTRESRGEFAINSLWFSGGGAKPAHWQAQATMFSQLPMVLGLAELSQVVCHAWPQDWESVSSKVLNNMPCHIVVNQLEDIPVDTLTALLQALKKRQIKTLTISFGQHAQVLEYQVTAWDSFKFWRPPQSISKQFNDVI